MTSNMDPGMMKRAAAALEDTCSLLALRGAGNAQPEAEDGEKFITPPSSPAIEKGPWAESSEPPKKQLRTVPQIHWKKRQLLRYAMGVDEVPDQVLEVRMLQIRVDQDRALKERAFGAGMPVERPIQAQTTVNEETVQEKAETERMAPLPAKKRWLRKWLKDNE